MIVQVHEQHLVIREGCRLVAGSVEVYGVRFVFDPSWDGLEKTAVFCASGGERVEVVLVEDQCGIPWEVLQPNTRLKIGVFGVGKGQRRPTLYSESLPVYRGAEGGDPARDPTPTLYEQWIGQVAKDRQWAQNAASLAQEAADRAVAAAVHEPRLSQEDTWLVWDQEAGNYRDTGLYGGGKAPQISPEGIWLIGGESTGVAAVGPQGPKGEMGPQGERGLTGPQGEKGQQGPGPVRGVDYWTAVDVAEIKGYVEDAILGGVW